jgi:hypothetical protein
VAHHVRLFGRLDKPPDHKLGKHQNHKSIATTPSFTSSPSAVNSPPLVTYSVFFSLPRPLPSAAAVGFLSSAASRTTFCGPGDADRHPHGIVRVARDPRVPLARGGVHIQRKVAVDDVGRRASRVGEDPDSAEPRPGGAANGNPPKESLRRVGEVPPPARGLEPVDAGMLPLGGRARR